MPDALSRLVRRPQGQIGLVLVALAVLAAAAGPLVAPYSPEEFHITARFQGPSAAYWLGTDQFGRDLLSRILLGARPTLLLAVVATLLGTGAGALIGTLSAFLGGRADEAIMRTVDAVMAIPGLLLALLIVTALGANAANALIAIGVAFAPGMARITRSVALTVRKQDYVNAAIARGESSGFIVLREMLPNVVAPIVVETTIRIAFSVMLLATLSFLGLGAQPPTPEWGAMAADGRNYLRRAWWVSTFPGLAVMITVLAINLLGDGLRDALDPRMKERR